MDIRSLFRKGYEDTWRDEISCRFDVLRMRLCKRLGGHYDGPEHWDEILRCRGRTCLLCRTVSVTGRIYQTVDATTSSSQATYTLTWR